MVRASIYPRCIVAVVQFSSPSRHAGSCHRRRHATVYGHRYRGNSSLLAPSQTQHKHSQCTSAVTSTTAHTHTTTGSVACAWTSVGRPSETLITCTQVLMCTEAGAGRRRRVRHGRKLRFVFVCAHTGSASKVPAVPARTPPTERRLGFSSRADSYHSFAPHQSIRINHARTFNILCVFAPQDALFISTARRSLAPACSRVASAGTRMRGKCAHARTRLGKLFASTTAHRPKASAGVSLAVVHIACGCASECVVAPPRGYPSSDQSAVFCVL